eukprot:3329511-Pleurochrysis_carterae.AAC.4
MQRTTSAGPSRRLPSSLASDRASRVHMLVMLIGRQGLCEDVGHFLGRVDLADLDAPMRNVLAYLQVGPIDVLRALAGA